MDSKSSLGNKEGFVIKMIEILFRHGGDVILVRIAGNNVEFGNTAQGGMLSTIDGLNISRSGVMRQFPDLKGQPDWKEQAIKRFKKHIATFKNEVEKAEYIKEELSKWGYVPWKIKMQGKRARDI